MRSIVVTSLLFALVFSMAPVSFAHATTGDAETNVSVETDVNTDASAPIGTRIKTIIDVFSKSPTESIPAGPESIPAGPTDRGFIPFGREIPDEPEDRSSIDVKSHIQGEFEQHEPTLSDNPSAPIGTRIKTIIDAFSKSFTQSESGSIDGPTMDRGFIPFGRVAPDNLEEHKDKLTDRAKDRIAAFAKRLWRRLAAAVERLEKLADRIESRIEKLEEKGFDLTEAKEFLEGARVEIAEAQEALEAKEIVVEELLESDDPKESFKEMRELAREVVESIKEAHLALVEAIKAIKAAGGLEKDTSSSDGENETDDE